MASDKIFVDLDEEIVFTVEKVLESGSDKVIVVIPESANLVASLVSLKLLSRQIARSPKTIVVVTEDSLGLKLSRKAGLVAKEKISQITPEVWAEAQKLKREFLEARTKLRDKLIGDRNESSSYEIVDTKSDTDEEHKEAVQEKKEEEKEPEYAPPLAKKPRLDPKVVNLGVVKVLGGGDIEKNMEFLSELKPEEVKEEPTVETNAAPQKQDAPEVELDQKQETVEAQEQEVPMNEEVEEPEEEVKQQKPQKKMNLIGRDLAAIVADSPRVERSRERQRQQRVRQNPNRGQLTKKLSVYIASFMSGGNFKYKLLGVAVVVLFFLYLFTTQILAGGDVTVYVSRTNVSIPETPVTAKADISEPDTENYIVPARQIKVSESSSSSVDTTGKAKDGEIAKGLITLYNKTEKEINLPAGTLVENITTTLKYKTSSATTIPAAVVDGGGNVNVGVEKDVPVEAESYGENYNTSGSATYKISGYTTDELSAKSFDDIEGGTTSDEKAVSQKDIDDLKQGLIDELKNTLKLELDQLVSSDEKLLEGSVKYSEPKVEADKKVGDKADSVSMTVTLDASAFVVKDGELKVIVAEVIKKESDFSGEVDLEELDEPTISDVEVDDDEVKFNVSAEGDITAKVTEEEVKSNLAGLSESDAKKYLESIDGVEEYKLSISPFYLVGPLKKMPGEGKIDVNIQVNEK